MALSFTEMRALQKQGTAIMADLKAGGLNFVEIRKKQREKAEIMAKLKGDAVKPEPKPDPVDEEGTDEEAEQEASRSVQGFELGGVSHPTWTKKYADKAGFHGSDVVLSNEGLKIAILLPPMVSDREIKRGDLRLAWPHFSAGTDAEDTGLSISADEAWAGVKSTLPPVLRKKVRRMVEQALATISKSFAEGVGGFALERLNNGKIRISRGDETSIGYTVQEAAAMLRTAGQGLEAVIPLLDEGSLASAKEKFTRELAKVEYTAHTMTEPELLAAIEQLTAIQARDELPLTAERIQEDLDLLGGYLTSVRRKPDPEPEPDPEPAPVVEDSLSVRYLRGDFNQEAPADFRGRILAVANEGMALDDLKTGAVNWIKANPDLIAA